MCQPCAGMCQPLCRTVPARVTDRDTEPVLVVPGLVSFMSERVRLGVRHRHSLTCMCHQWVEGRVRQHQIAPRAPPSSTAPRASPRPVPPVPSRTSTQVTPQDTRNRPPVLSSLSPMFGAAERAPLTTPMFGAAGRGVPIEHANPTTPMFGAAERAPLTDVRRSRTSLSPRRCSAQPDEASNRPHPPPGRAIHERVGVSVRRAGTGPGGRPAQPVEGLRAGQTPRPADPTQHTPHAQSPNSSNSSNRTYGTSRNVCFPAPRTASTPNGQE